MEFNTQMASHLIWVIILETKYGLKLLLGYKLMHYVHPCRTKPLHQKYIIHYLEYIKQLQI